MPGRQEQGGERAIPVYSRTMSVESSSSVNFATFCVIIRIGWKVISEFAMSCLPGLESEAICTSNQLEKLFSWLYRLWLGSSHKGPLKASKLKQMPGGVNMRSRRIAQDGIALPNLDARESSVHRWTWALPPEMLDLQPSWSYSFHRYSYFVILHFDFKLWAWKYVQWFC